MSDKPKYEHKTYGTAWVQLDGGYTIQDLKAIIAEMERWNLANEQSMREMDGEDRSLYSTSQLTYDPSK